MGQAEELLNSMSTEVPVHTHPVPDTDTYFIIDPITRKIENTNPKKNVIMQYDHNSERCTFELPRYIDGHDMLECTSVTVNVDNIEIGVEEPRVNSDAPDMTDLRIHPNDPEKVISSWLISRNSTQLAGILRFHIEYKCVDSEGSVVYEWSTDNYDEIEIRSRKKNGEAAIAPHIDTLEQWRTRIFGAGDSVMANIAAEGETQIAAVKAESETQQEAVELKGAQTLDSIPEDYTEVDTMAEEAIRTKGDAIVCEVSGKTLGFADASNNYIRGLNVFGKSTQLTTIGKNLFKTGFVSGHTETVKGVTFTVNPDGSIHVKGTPNAAIAYNIFEGEVLPVGNYFISGAPGTAGQKFRLQVNVTVDGIEKTGGVDMGAGSKFSVDASVSSLRGYIYVASDAGAVEGTFYPQIELGTTATSYEPYTGGKPSPNPEYPQAIASIENPTIFVCGKNLVRTNNNKDVTYEGLHFSITKGLSEITLDGTTTKSYGYAISEGTYLPPGRYTMSVYGLNNVSAKYDQAYLMNTTTRETVCAEVKSGSPVTFDVLEGAIHRIDFLFAEGTTYNNATIRFQIEAGSEVTDYEPCNTAQLLTLDRAIPGIPVTSGGNYTDENGQQWICDEVDLERGVYVQRILKYTFTGNESWHLHESGRYYAAIGNALGLSFVSQCVLCTHVSMHKRADYGDYCTNGTGGFYFNQSDIFNTVDALKTYLQTNDVTAHIALSTPIETPLTAEEITAFKALRTNYPNTTILNDAGAWMSVKYNADTKSYVDKPKTLRLTDTSTGVVYELKIVDGNLTVVPV